MQKESPSCQENTYPTAESETNYILRMALLTMYTHLTHLESIRMTRRIYFQGDSDLESSLYSVHFLSLVTSHQL